MTGNKVPGSSAGLQGDLLRMMSTQRLTEIKTGVLLYSTMAEIWVENCVRGCGITYSDIW